MKLNVTFLARKLKLTKHIAYAEKLKSRQNLKPKVMKKFTLLVSVLLIGLTTANATEINSERGNGILDNTRYHNAQPITFVERGVEFLIFPDGSFDFNTELDTYGDLYYRSSSTERTRRSSVNTTHGAPGQNTSGGILITHDVSGKVRRIGNVFINYDREGKIKRAGTVYMTYNRGNGTLTQVGGLKVRYNTLGKIVNLYGQVNQESLFMNGSIAQSYTQNSGYATGYYSTTSSSNSDYYYYRKNENK